MNLALLGNGLLGQSRGYGVLFDPAWVPGNGVLLELCLVPTGPQRRRAE